MRALHMLSTERLESRRLFASANVAELVNDLQQQHGVAIVGSPVVFRDRVYFYANRTTSADSGQPGLYGSDGTARGTTLIALTADSGLFTQQPVGTSRGLFYVNESSAKRKGDLFLTNGRAGSRRLLRAGFQEISNVTALDDGTIVFTARTKDAGREVWRSDGTARGTVMVRDIVPGPRGSNPRGFAQLDNGAIVFAARDSAHGDELWRTDGTKRGTRMIADIRPGHEGGAQFVQQIVTANGVGFFSAYDPIHGHELRRTDGTADGTKLVRDLVPGTSTVLPVQLTASERGIFFGGRSTVTGEFGLFESDGTETGTQRAATLPGEFLYIDRIAVTRSRVFVSAVTQRQVDKQLFSFDRSTRALAVASPPLLSQPSFVSAVDNDVFFYSSEPTRLQSIRAGEQSARVVFGESGAIKVVYNAPVSVRGSLFFVGSDERHALALWKLPAD